MSEPKPCLRLQIVSGVEGSCAYLGDYRIAGPKPWGGGHVTHDWRVDPDDIEHAIAAWNQRTEETKS